MYSNLLKIAELAEELAKELRAIAQEETKAAPVAEPVAPAEEKTEAPAEEATAPAVAEEKVPARTVAEVRDLASKAIKSGLRAEAKALVAKYGDSISSIGSDDLGCLYVELEKLMEEKDA